MEFNFLFDKRNLVAENLKQVLCDKGFTKVAFAKKSDISRPTLDKLLSNQIDSKTTFDSHMNKVLQTLNLSVEELMLYQSHSQKVNAVFSKNEPENYEMTSKANKQYECLMEVLDLCSIYY